MLPKLESIEVLFPAAAYIFQTSAIIIAALSRDGKRHRHVRARKQLIYPFFQEAKRERERERERER